MKHFTRILAALLVPLALVFAMSSPAAAGETIHNYVEKRTTCAGHESRVVEEIHTDGGELVETRYTAWKVDQPLSADEYVALGCDVDECPTDRVAALSARVEAQGVRLERKADRIDSLRARVDRLRDRLNHR